MEQFTDKQKKDLKVLIRFVQVYCLARHADQPACCEMLPPETADIAGKEPVLCHECAALVSYAMERRRKCPLEPKPSCKSCRIHCYSRQHRVRIREIMAFSGRRMILKGRIDYLWHYLF